MYTLLKPLEVRETLLKKNVTIFTHRDFALILGVPTYKAKYFLEKESSGGLLVRFKRGLYGMRTELPREESLANRLYQPSYVSFEYALGSYGVIPEMPYAVTSATTMPTRTFTVEGKAFIYSTIKKEAYTGYVLLKREGASFLMAEPEKALVDYLYFVTLGKKSLNDRFDTGRLRKDKLIAYARVYRREKLMRRIEEIA